MPSEIVGSARITIGPKDKVTTVDLEKNAFRFSAVILPKNGKTIRVLTKEAIPKAVVDEILAQPTPILFIGIHAKWYLGSDRTYPREICSFYVKDVREYGTERLGRLGLLQTGSGDDQRGLSASRNVISIATGASGARVTSLTSPMSIKGRDTRSAV
jgi:hypothetical protein